jgi:hypothetical protein
MPAFIRRDISVSVVTGHGLNGRISIPGKINVLCSLPHPNRLWVYQGSYTVKYRRFSSSGVKWPGREAPTGAEVNSAYSLTSTPA